MPSTAPTGKAYQTFRTPRSQDSIRETPTTSRLSGRLPMSTGTSTGNWWSRTPSRAQRCRAVPVQYVGHQQVELGRHGHHWADPLHVHQRLQIHAVVASDLGRNWRLISDSQRNPKAAIPGGPILEVYPKVSDNIKLRRDPATPVLSTMRARPLGRNYDRRGCRSFSMHGVDRAAFGEDTTFGLTVVQTGEEIVALFQRGE